MPVIQRQEWFWVLTWSAVIVILVSVPYLYGALLSKPDNQFGGFVIGVEDGNSYLAKMRLGAGGGWRFHLFYTSEPHEGAYVYLFYLFLGKIARVTGLSFIVSYHLARLSFGYVLLITVYYFTAFFSILLPVRRLSFWLVAIGSGLGWLIVLAGWAEWLGLPLDFYSPEAFTFHALFGLPHLALVEILLLWSFLFILLGWERNQWGYAFFAGLALLGVAVVGAFYVPVFVAVIGVTWLLRTWRSRGMGDLVSKKKSFLEIGLVVVAVGFAVPVILYDLYVFLTNPFFRIWAEQNRILSPSPFHYFLAFGLLFPLAVLGGWQLWQNRSSRNLLLIGWCVVVPLLLYLPFNLQRRMSLGFQITLSILAALGWWQLWSRWVPSLSGNLSDGRKLIRYRPGATAALVLLLSLSNLLILVGTSLEVSQQASPIFRSASQISAARWLDKQLSSDEPVVLGTYETGNLLPVYASVRVFVGHGPETIYSDQKRDWATKFFETGTSDGWRQSLLKKYNIDYVYYGFNERSLGDFNPEKATYLRKVYEADEVSLYSVILQ